MGLQIGDRVSIIKTIGDHSYAKYIRNTAYVTGINYNGYRLDITPSSDNWYEDEIRIINTIPNPPEKFKKGEIVEVSNYKDKDIWTRRIFIADLKLDCNAIVVVSESSEESYKKGESFKVAPYWRVRKINNVSLPKGLTPEEEAAYKILFN